MTKQPHARLSRGAPALLAIARHAAGDDVLPVFAAALRHRHDMVERQFRRRKRVVAVLAGVIVARVDVGPGERHVIEAAFYLDEAEEADDGGQLEAERNRPYLALVVRDHLHFSLAPERNRLLPVNDLQWLVRRVQKERLLHSL